MDTKFNLKVGKNTFLHLILPELHKIFISIPIYLRIILLYVYLLPFFELVG